MQRSVAKRKVQTLVDAILAEHGSSAWLSIISDKGKVDSVAVNRIEGGSPTAAKKHIRAWAKKNKVKLTWVKLDAPKRKNPKKK